MNQLTTGISNLGFWSLFADFHGSLAMLSLVLFGAALVLFFQTKGNRPAVSKLKLVLNLLFLDIALLDIAGLTVYIPYRTEGGPRSLLKSSPSTQWLHSIVFEHKEFLAFAPLVLTLTAFLIVHFLDKSFSDNHKFPWFRKTVVASIVLSLVFVLTVAAQAVIVTKAAPLG